jgi:predicted GNAT family acetyltransferase
MKKTAVEWLISQLNKQGFAQVVTDEEIEQAKEMDKERMLDFGDFIIDELAPMAQNRDWVEERYNYFKSEEDESK